MRGFPVPELDSVAAVRSEVLAAFFDRNLQQHIYCDADPTQLRHHRYFGRPVLALID